jgi:hypothetical protein
MLDRDPGRQRTNRAYGMARQALHLCVSFVIVRSHYVNIDLQAMSQGFMPDYDDAELDQIEEELAPSHRSLLQVWRRELFPRSS